MTLTQILQKIRNAFYTKKEIDSMGGGGASLSDTISQKADKSDLSNYLPLSGGNLRNGDNSIGVSVDNNSLSLYGGYTRNTCSRLMLIGADANDGRKGGFVLRAKPSSSKNIDLVGTPNGSLTWNEKYIDVIEEKGDNYIRYTNGIQICWGRFPLTASAGSDTTFNFPKPFATYGFGVTLSGQSQNIYLNGQNPYSFVVKNVSYVDIYIDYTAIGSWK